MIKLGRRDRLLLSQTRNFGRDRRPDLGHGPQGFARSTDVARVEGLGPDLGADASVRSIERERPLTGIDRTFGDNEIIVSKTDPAGRITYANDVFCRMSGYTEEELIGRPHSLLRHPQMPRVIFKMLWERLQVGREIFAFVLNRCKSSDEYWVFAHITPTLRGGQIVGHHSNRRTVNRAALPQVRTLYGQLLAEQQRHSKKADGIAASQRLLDRLLAESGLSYDEMVWSLESRGRAVTS